jgi:adenosylcobalamin-dependent ribonucleoside-diphosphate reductase
MEDHRMTEISESAQGASAKGSGDDKPSINKRGVRIERVFTTPGVHPYDEVTWEPRDVVQQNWRTGETVFEQRGVEFPDFWSVNASTIVTTKYFRGAAGSDSRERSLKQLLDRVVLTYTKAGKEHGYFTNDEDAEIFEHELTWALLHQVFSFNSPVWFNVGTSAPQQVSACFILAVDDTMDSILNWYREEGLIFKGGSGAGINLSRIRSSKELLSSGGTASGPVSFMRGADASAGTIKSGGATRRAAKMVVLDVDHPDIEEFIETKWREEDKIRALRDAGYDMDLGGRDITSVQYQNANNSIRVTDTFMRAVEDGTEFGLTARKTGEVIETIDARTLWTKVAQAAWACADPGIQYDGTINDWHTNPETGRITASNPCSEYLSLDNSSCNLASINLLKFLQGDHTFDGVTFSKVVELVTTAMDISICFADFPTEAITETTRAYRQLGIGYANLGALLMASGLAYDSPGGQALAAAITSLMTGVAYKRSAELAGIVGPYEGFARNAEAHSRVMRKHQAANDELRAVTALDRDVHEMATKAWSECLETGANNGWRNAQASLLAPTGTIGFMMDADTTGIEPDFSLVKFKKLVGGGSMQIVNQTIPRALRKLGYAEETIEAIVEYIAEKGHVVGAPGLRLEHYEVFDCAVGERSIAPMGHVRMMAAVQPFLSGAISKCVTGETLVATGDGLVRIGSWYDGETADSFRDHVVEVASLGGPTKTDAFYYGGLRPTRRVVLRSGHTVTGTPNHRLLVAVDGGLDWRTLDDIAPGDYVATSYGANLWSDIPASLRHIQVSAPYGSQKLVTLPQEMTKDLAFLLGAYASQGHTTRSTWTITITNSQPNVLAKVRDAWESIFGLHARIVEQPGRCPGVVVASKTAVELLEALGCGARASHKRIPDAVLRSPKPMVLAFLQGLALDAYVTTGPAAKWGICLDSPALLDDLQAVLTNLGVVHGRVSKANKDYDKSFDEVYACGEHAAVLLKAVPFLEADKARRAVGYLALGSRAQSTADVVPGITGRELYGLLPKGTSGRDGKGSGRSQFAFLLDPRTQHVSRRTLERVAAFPDVRLPEWLSNVLRDSLHFSPVTEVADVGAREVYDVSVPTTHAFVANGIVNHNTVNMPESSTVDEVKDVYFQGWKMGLKALAIYRDNCKVGQPLSDAKSKTSDSAFDAHAPVVVARPTRKRLPKSRPSVTTSFAVAGAEGYMTAGSYPDDGLGEVFLKLGKQGSTLAGVMDAFSIAISIALQYGVPLETYVQKFTNMRFDPAGMTDDPDIRMAQSVMDYIFRRLALDYMSFEERSALGIYTAEERTRQLETGSYEASADETDLEALAQGVPTDERPVKKPDEVVVAEAAKPVPVEVHSSAELMESLLGTAADAPMCFTCGTKMRPAGSCYVCEGCGSTSGCS